MDTDMPSEMTGASTSPEQFLPPFIHRWLPESSGGSMNRDRWEMMCFLLTIVIVSVCILMWEWVEDTWGLDVKHAVMWISLAAIVVFSAILLYFYRRDAAGWKDERED